MSRVIFLTHPTIGHLNSLLSIALKLRENGHNVQFIVPGSNLADPRIKMFKVFYNGKVVPEKIRSHGFPIHLLFPPLPYLYFAARLPSTKRFEETKMSLRLFSSGLKSYTRRINRLVQKFRPDMIVADFFFYAAPLVAEMNSLPYAAIYHCGLPFSGKDVPPFGSGLPVSTQDTQLMRSYKQQEQAMCGRLNAAINRARQTFLLRPVVNDMLKSPHSPWLNLIVTHESIDIPRGGLESHTVYVGPIFTNMGTNRSPFPYEDLKNDKYKIYVSLGTVFNDKPKTYLKIIDALQGNPNYLIIVSAGGSYEAVAKKSHNSNVMLFQSVPQADLLRHVDLVISHGGNNTLNETLYHGKPVIVLPVGGEQHDNASRIEFFRMGCRLDMDSLSDEALRSTVEKIRNNTEMNRRLEDVSKELRNSDGITSSVRLIEWVMEHRRPFAKKNHLPQTISKHMLDQYLQD